MKPIIEESEFKRRKKQVQNLMSDLNLDLIVAYADDRFVYGQAYARWLVNYQPQFEPALVLVPAAGDTVIATGAESVEFILNSSYCQKANAIQEFLHPDEDYPYCEITSLDKVRKGLEEQMGRPIEKIGLCGGSAVPYPTMKMLQAQFGKENISDIDRGMSMLRAVKSENELEVIRYAYKIAEAGMNRIRETLKEGITEREAAAEAEYVMRKMGSEGMGIETMVASGIRNTAPILSRTTSRKLKEGDLVVVTLAPRYEGYHGAIARPFFLGTPSADMKERLALLKDSQERTAAILRPGISAREADKVSRQLINAAGLGEHFTYTGIHSTGVIEFESPILSAGSAVKIEKDMVFSIDIPLFLNDWGGMRLENGYRITEEGAEPLNSLDISFQI